MNENQITVDSNGNCTVIGALAHKLYFTGGFPRARCSKNVCYVYEFNDLPQGWRWEIVEWHEKLIQVDPNQVLVDVSNAPIKTTDLCSR